LNGKITGTFSESVNNAPVVVTLDTDEGPRDVAFERRLWNDFFDAHADRIRDDDFRVVVNGEPWEASIRCCGDRRACDPEG
jgi:hypothetical protein